MGSIICSWPFLRQGPLKVVRLQSKGLPREGSAPSPEPGAPGVELALEDGILPRGQAVGCGHLTHRIT